MDKESNIYQVVSILLNSIYIKYYNEILFAWCTDTSSDIEIEWTSVVFVLKNIIVSAQVEYNLLRC